MSSYSKEELRAMSLALLRYKEENNPAYYDFLAFMIQLTGNTISIEAEILKYSKLEVA